jgi:hypothetical protein
LKEHVTAFESKLLVQLHGPVAGVDRDARDAELIGAGAQRTAVGGSPGSALPLLALALRPPAYLLMIAFFVAGVAIEQFSIAWDQSLQTHVSEDRLARVYSYDALGSFAAVPMGEALIGPLAAVLSVPLALVACSTAIVLATGAALSQRAVRTLQS